MAELPGISNFGQPDGISGQPDGISGQPEGISGQPDGISQTPMSQEGKTIPSKNPESYEKIFREKKI